MKKLDANFILNILINSYFNKLQTSNIQLGTGANNIIITSTAGGTSLSAAANE